MEPSALFRPPPSPGWNRVVAAMLVLAGLGGLSAAILALAQGALFGPARIVLYGVLPAVAGMGCLATLAASATNRAVVLSNLLAAGLAFVIGDLFLQYQQWDEDYAPERLIQAAQEHQTVQALRQHRRNEGNSVHGMVCAGMLMAEAEGRGIAPVLSGADGPLLPLGGVAHSSAVELIVGQPIVRRFDEHGFNNPPGQWSTPSPLLVVGDSFAFGAGVAPGHGAVDLIRAGHGPTVNLGCGGNGPLAELAALAEYGPHLKPSTVLWLYFEGNDVVKDIVREAKAAFFHRYLTGEFSQNLLARQNEIDTAVAGYIATVPEPQARDHRPPFAPDWMSAFTLTHLRSALGLSHALRPQALTLFARTIAQARSRVAAWGGRLVFVYLPGEVRFAGALGGADGDAARERILDAVAAQGIGIVDLTPRFAEHPSPRNLFRGHYTEAGYRLVAETVMAALQGGLPARP